MPSTPVKAVAAALWRSQQARDDTERRAAMASDHPLDMDHRDVTERLAAAERLLNRWNWRDTLLSAGTGSTVVAGALTFAPSLPGKQVLIRTLQLWDGRARRGRLDATRGYH